MLQREVVERITTKPGNKERGFLTVLTEAYFQTEKLFDVPSKAFLPVPKVTSSVMRLITKKDGLIKIKNEKFFRELVSFGFRQKRKTIKNNIKVFNKEMEKRFEMAIDLDKIISELELNPKKRPEDLELEEWIDLSNFYSEF
jgi:16S rRNA (adenine1518-N6/adenine1519-N6)-dimethyltransferase